jgi:hypothetical protein
MQTVDEPEMWMLVTASHIIEYHGIKYTGRNDINKEHLIEHLDILRKQDHKHFTSDLKASLYYVGS